MKAEIGKGKGKVTGSMQKTLFHIRNYRKILDSFD